MNQRREIESGPEAVAGLSRELQHVDNQHALQDAFYLSEKFPGDLVKELWKNAGNARTIGVTGAPGVGKSTMIPGLVSNIRDKDSTVGVIAVDPSSPISGGSIMGDRGRILDSAKNYNYDINADNGVWIRSFSAAGNLGGVSAATFPSILAFDVSGKDVVIVETVGVGQSELDINSLVDTTVVLLQPASGDSIQAMKSGLMEIPDVICVNKRDVFKAKTFQEIRSDLRMTRTPVVEINAATGEGIEDLLDAIEEHQNNLGEEGIKERRKRSLAAQLAQLSIAYTGFDIKRLLASDIGTKLLEDVSRREKDPFSAAQELRKLI